jgi:hypothetical protein
MGEWGTFNVDRGVFGHPVFADEAFTEREAWMWLIAQAAFKPHRKRVGRVVVDLARGQLAHSTRFMAKAWKWSEASVRRFLAKLAREKMVTIAPDAELTQLTICNYDSYQASPKKRDAEPTQNRRTTLADDDALRARADELAEQVYDIFGFDRDFIPPAWMGMQAWLEAGVRSGWKPDLVRLAARKVAARKKGGPPHNFRYLGPAIAQEHELAAAPPPPAATVHRFAEQGHETRSGQRSVHDVARELARQFRRDEPEPDEQRHLPLLRTVGGGRTP